MTTQKRKDRVEPTRAAALMAAVGDQRAVAVGTALPPYSHLAFFWDVVDASGLGKDGRPQPGGLSPDMGLPLRMWSGGRTTWHQPFTAGVRSERISQVTAVQRKEGRTGKLAFVSLRHDIRQAQAPVLTEEQTFVHCETAALEAEAPVETGEADQRMPLKLTAVELFRYSAVTFDAHRIHYDADYAREAGYPGIVVQTPLLAMNLASFAETSLSGVLRTFEFRATAPLYLGDVAWLCRARDRFWVEGPRRRICLEAIAG